MLTIQARAILNDCARHELRDHAFGDVEVTWTDRDGKDVAWGYFGSSKSTVCFQSADGPVEAKFEGPMAQELRSCGSDGHISRNDTTGPDEFHQGEVMEGLTHKNVFTELTGNVGYPTNFKNRGF